MYDRRQFLQTALSTGIVLGASGLVPAWARPASAGNYGIPSLTGTEFDLRISKFPIAINGRETEAVGVNGSVPAPLIRFREGEEVTFRVKNDLASDSSIHWHGLLVPFEMDGVPGVSFPGIKPGQTFTYKYAVPQSGTYWYHSHSGLQEQLGHYGPIIIDPKDRDPVQYDREYVLMLGDWTFTDPARIFSMLKKNPESLNYNRPTLGKPFGLGGMWGAMRMSPNDLADVTGETYTYVINGHSTADNFNMVFNPGERVRLRIINAAAMTLFNVRMPGLPMRVVQADGLNIQPVETDEFQIGVAETYDVIVEPKVAQSFAFVAESIDRSGQVVATLGPRPGMRAREPKLRTVPVLTMKDMGMDHTAMGHGQMAKPTASSPRSMEHAAMGNMASGTDMSSHDGMNHGPDPHGPPVQIPRLEAKFERAPGVANVAAMPVGRLDEPGIGLENMAHRTLSYSQLRSLEPNPDIREPGREVVVHLTSNMERYMWSFDGVKFSEVTESIKFMEGERLRLTLVNNTMMPHPIHLHGMFFDLVNGGGRHKPRKHTVVVKPGETLSADISAEHVGDWAFHCHLIYHMHAGMMQVVSVLPHSSRHSGMMHERMSDPGQGAHPQHGNHAANATSGHGGKH